MLYRIGIYLTILACLIGCRSDDLQREYIFLAHTYQSKTRIDDRLVEMDLSIYDQIWLGGDICVQSTAETTTIDHIDEVFGISRPSTQWALGNHDSAQGNLDRITNRTGRPTSYATHFDGITLLVLNSNLSLPHSLDSIRLNEQFDLIKSVCDTITYSSHLVVISHHSHWGEIAGCSEVKELANTDGTLFPYRFEPRLTYSEAVYPLLVEVKNQGVEVIHLAGDFGQITGGFERLTPEGIHFIGSGTTAQIKHNEQFPSASEPDSILIFHHDLIERSLTWSRQLLPDEMAKSR